MIIIGIDPSLSSTSIVIKTEDEAFFYNYTNNKPNYKWIKKTSDIINFKFHNYKQGKDYSDNEIEKLIEYDKITTNIVNDIIDIICNHDDNDVRVYIEGFSYSSNAGRIIDLVTFSTLLRAKLLKTQLVNLNVISPSELKKSVASLVYTKDKKGMYRDDSGKAGGMFDKRDIMVAILKLNNKMGTSYEKFLIDNQDELLKTKNIPKPFDDTTDSLSLVYHGMLVNNILK